MHVHSCVPVSIHESAMGRPEVGVGCLPLLLSTLYFETGALPEA